MKGPEGPMGLTGLPGVNEAQINQIVVVLKGSNSL